MSHTQTPVKPEGKRGAPSLSAPEGKPTGKQRFSALRDQDIDTVHLVIPTSLREVLDAEAQRRQTSRSAIGREALAQYLLPPLQATKL